jgi:hypothetical protein
MTPIALREPSGKGDADLHGLTKMSGNFALTRLKSGAQTLPTRKAGL